jgi:hypothetical protein
MDRDAHVCPSSFSETIRLHEMPSWWAAENPKITIFQNKFNFILVFWLLLDTYNDEVMEDDFGRH